MSTSERAKNHKVRFRPNHDGSIKDMLAQPCSSLVWAVPRLRGGSRSRVVVPDGDRRRD